MQSEPPAPLAQPPINGTLWVAGPGERVARWINESWKCSSENL